MSTPEDAMNQDRELHAMATALGALEELAPDEQSRVISWLGARLGIQGARLGTGGGKAQLTDDDHDAALGTIKQFMTSKAPRDDVARATALAYYLARGADQPTYTTADLTRARLDAALAAFNVSRSVSNAVRAGYLTAATSRGSYQITSTGEALVDAMPDPEAVRSARAPGTRRRRRSSRARSRTQEGDQADSQ